MAAFSFSFKLYYYYYIFPNINIFIIGSLTSKESTTTAPAPASARVQIVPWWVGVSHILSLFYYCSVLVTASFCLFASAKKSPYVTFLQEIKELSTVNFL